VSNKDRVVRMAAGKVEEPGDLRARPIEFPRAHRELQVG
jgi:hypothetical protein